MLKAPQSKLFIALAILIYIFSLLQLNSTSFLYGLAQVASYFFFGMVMIYSIYKFLTDKRPISRYKKFQPTLLGLLLIGSFFLLTYLIETDGGKRTAITAGLDGDVYYIRLNLHTDKTFRLINSGPFGGNIYRGNYTLENDTLKIDNAELKYLYPTLTFTVKQTGNKKYFEPVYNTDTIKGKHSLYIRQ
jgi:energy-coupling factor transporter transmembrane protein EcfT